MKSSGVKSIINDFKSRDFKEGNKAVEEAVQFVESIFNTASSLSLPLRMIKQSKKKKQICQKKWFDFDCREVRKELRYLSNLKHSDPSNSYVRQQYNHKLKSFKKLLKIKKYNFQRDKLQEIQSNSTNSNFWKILKSAKEDIENEFIPPISENKWIDHFTNLHKRPTLTLEQLNIEGNLAQLERNSNQINDILNSPITLEEIHSCVKSLKNNKASASDKIKNEMIRHSIDEMCLVYLKLFNLILKSGIFPDTWCIGSLTPIFKSGDVSDTNNYRGICVSSCLGKFFSLILNQRLLNYVQSNSILHNSQIGFMPGYRTTDHIFSLRTIFDKYVSGAPRGKIYACFIDFKKAFDSVWHDGLFTRLLLNNINGNFYSLIKSLYSKSKCFIKLRSKRTKTFKYTRGVRQGCTLSPLLFNLYLNELSLQLDRTIRSDPIILPNNARLSSLLYADDLVLLSKSKQGLQNCIDSVGSFCSQWQMNVNEKKTKIMIFRKKRCQKINQPSFKINRKNIDIVDEFTYLGVKLSSSGNFNAHLNQSKEKALHAYFKLTQIINLKELKSNAATKLFDSLISPILTYGCEVWGAYQKQNFDIWDKNQIEKVHLRFCKYYLGINRKSSNLASRSELGRFPLKIFIDTLILKFYNHLVAMHDDSIAKQMFLISKSLSSNAKPSFHLNVQNILKLYNLDHLFVQGDNPITKDNLNNYKCKMKEQYFYKWKIDVQASTKLSFFNSLKDHYECETYLDFIDNFDERRNLTKLRVSNHKLEVESGRYIKLPYEDRKCNFCKENAVESEIHFLYHCSYYGTLRKNFFDKINQTCNNLDFIKFTRDLFDSNNEKLVQHFSRFVFKCFKLREENNSLNKNV